MLFSYTGRICIETLRFFLIYFFIVKDTIVLAACKGNLGTTWPKSAKWYKFWGGRWRCWGGDWRGCWGGHYIYSATLDYLVCFVNWFESDVTIKELMRETTFKILAGFPIANWVMADGFSVVFGGQILDLSCF